MSRVLLECAFLILVTAWVLAETLSLGRSSDKRANSQLASNVEKRPANDPRDPGFSTLPVAVMIILILLLVPGTVTSNGQSISLNEISDSMQTSMDVGPAATFVSAWRAEYPIGFWGFFAGLPLTVIWLARRSPVLLGAAVVAGLFVFWLKMKTGLSTLSF